MTDSEAVMNLLRKVPLFANLKDEDKVCIEETEEWRLPAGEMLFQEGQHTEHFLFFSRERSSSGRNRVTKKLLSLATDLVCFSAKSRSYSTRLICCPHAPSAIAG
jgi:hypothetical protein